MTKRTAPCSPEVRERAVRMVRDHKGEPSALHAAIQSIAAKIGRSGEALGNWIRQADPAKVPPRAKSDAVLMIEIRPRVRGELLRFRDPQEPAPSEAWGCGGSAAARASTSPAAPWRG